MWPVAASWRARVGMLDWQQEQEDGEHQLGGRSLLAFCQNSSYLTHIRIVLITLGNVKNMKGHLIMHDRLVKK